MKNSSLLAQRQIVRSLIFTCTVLLVPLVAMQFSEDVNWTGLDFAAAGILLFVTGLAYGWIFTRFPTRRQRLIATAVLTIGFLYIWAELAVGVFFNFGS